ncbi:MAG: glycosyltransferase [Gammaproteobacteria bacterium]|nr:glycosyltransferase [Gammaproteobacteria bacterium]
MNNHYFSTLEKDTPVFLIFDHAIGGGSNFYRSNLTESVLESGKAFLLIYFESGQYKANLKTKISNEELSFFDFKKLEDVLQPLNITDIFYNHLALYVDPLLIVDYLIRATDYFSAKLTVAIHDFFLICPSYALMSYQDAFCGVPADIQNCLNCLHRNEHALYKNPDISIIDWRNQWGKCLEKASEIKCFSKSSLLILQKAYPTLDITKVKIEPHKMNYLAKNEIHENRKIDKCLHIGVVGHIDQSTHKGERVVREMLKVIQKENLEIKFNVIGKLSDCETYSFLTVTGKYTREELPTLINKSGVNVFFIPSICSETFSYVTHELIGFNLPLASFNIGSQAEAVSSYKKGYIITEMNAQTAIKELQYFYELMLVNKVF